MIEKCKSGRGTKNKCKKKHPKKTIEKCNSERGKHEKWRKVQIRPGTNWTNMISEKSCKSLGKSKQNAKKKREKCNKSAKKCKSDLGPNWTNVIAEKNALPIIGKIQEKYELRFYTCIFLAFVILHFFALCFCTCICFVFLICLFFALYGARTAYVRAYIRPRSPPRSHVRTPAVPSLRWPYAPPRSIRLNIFKNRPQRPFGFSKYIDIYI